MPEPTAAELNESAVNHLSRGNGVEAAKQLQWALIADPEYAEAWANRAMVLQSLNDPFDAALCLEKALALDPCPEYLNMMGVCWALMSQLGTASEYYEKALAGRPEFAEALHNLASARKITGNIEAAVDLYRKALVLKQDQPNYHLSYAGALLASGRLAEGWKEYAWRFKSPDSFRRHIALPQWEGQPCKGLLLYAEQGFGDAIQFVRYAPILRRQYGIPVYVEVKKPMVELCKTMQDIDGVVAYGDPIPEGCEYALSMMDAPIHAGTDIIADIPADIPYFKAHPKPGHASMGWGTLKVGLCWHTGIRPYQPELKDFAERKSILPHFLAPFAKLKGITWVNLQLPRPEQLPFDGIVDLTHEIHDFQDTATLMQSLDIVVSVDTSVAHLAGALGKRTLLMTPLDNCWRWLGDRADSPWYPSLTQFRQPQPGNWPDVIARVCAELEQARTSWPTS